MSTKKPCPEGFYWSGMPHASCDKCGLPVWEHDGRTEIFHHKVTMALIWRLKPWEPGERELMQERWAASSKTEEAR